ncbi:COX15/CtaA family protein [Massilia antarctica]|uniref:COX15/CtaA family protein n=1 Tax=Massilia antarctica TaxID=2765360 RepID=UPI0006BB66B6|nr:COX15/CtaA family protein [Massilia sp. H27-R4]MCY0912929.1 COX15/CtaA family protein [Massilia sp. H27-R4]CUI07504.1 Heme A synthase, cytochrome oxidase biogenesis protein Cox15-CtaA [Janthinobacterium sp. CG23_2]CUU31290.1 Heme A synthase, cytochrome oxidase biogenesis protein Cox15-CtaA [Janthinobacterium sp. CG23_2]
MQLSSMVQLGAQGLLAACLPLAMVWMSSDPNKYRKLVWITVFLTFDLIVFGAFTRLTDSGLGCPDWPGCYGAANPFLAHADISAAETLMPTGPVTVQKAWIEMIHRFGAMAIGVLVAALTATAWIQWRKTRRAEFAPGLPTVLLGMVLLQGAFGAWTVTLKLQPVIVTTHLLLGMGLLSMLVWLGARQNRAAALAHGRFTAPAAAPPGAAPSMLGRLALAAALVLAVQIALGGWVSTNYATLACADFPLCNGNIVPEMDFGHGFTLWRALGKTAAGHYLPFAALTAIHWVHRNFAFVVLAVLGLAAWRARAHPGVGRHARGIAIVLALQATTGIATVYLNFPLTIAVLHNAGAALLVLMVTMLNYKIKYPSGPVLQASHHQ